MDAKRIDVSENMVAVRSLIEQFPQASGVLVGKYDLEALLTAAGERQGLRERCAELERLLRVARSFLPLCIFQSEGTDMAVVIDEIDDALGKEASTP